MSVLAAKDAITALLSLSLPHARPGNDRTQRPNTITGIDENTESGGRLEAYLTTTFNTRSSSPRDAKDLSDT